mgnify:CR=1 FL=1|tara:strand:- start:95 stop:874 length:780 start_codon:yes stop_codon:yes gene_type:complete
MPLERKEWDSEFFGREIYYLDVSNISDWNSISESITSLDRKMVWGIEAHVPIQKFSEISILEDLGFRLVDSRAEFRTPMKSSDFPSEIKGEGTVRSYSEADLSDILEITKECFVENIHFKSRYNNRNLFSKKESEKYYHAWITNSIRSPDTYCAVWEYQGKTQGFFLYKHKVEDGEDVLKGILTGVREDFRGHSAHLRMQSFLYSKFGLEEFTLDNSTQITNVPVIQNHIRSRKRLAGMKLILYRKNQNSLSNFAGTPT